MNEMFCLIHSYDNEIGEPEDKILGYFISEEDANNAIGIYLDLPGFRDHSEGFIVDRIKFGHLFWIEGFETLLDNKPV